MSVFQLVMNSGGHSGDVIAILDKIQRFWYYVSTKWAY